MALLQFSIGALNDLRDAGLDAGRKPRKPIPRGLVGEGTARMVVAACGAAGLALAVPSGWPGILVALAGVGVGYLYDLRLRGTALSWLPFCLGIPLVPLYAWAGSTGGLPLGFLVLIPLAALAGAAISIANALADLERDRSAASASVVTRLGARRAWIAATALHGAVAAAVPGTVVALVGPGGLAGWNGALVAAGALLVLAGLTLGTPSATPGRRELGWEAQAAGVGLLGIGWLLAVAGSPAFAGQ